MHVWRHHSCFRLQEFIKKNENPVADSGQQEHYESILNYYVWSIRKQLCFTKQRVNLASIVDIKMMNRAEEVIEKI